MKNLLKVLPFVAIFILVTAPLSHSAKQSFWDKMVEQNQKRLKAWRDRKQSQHAKKTKPKRSTRVVNRRGKCGISGGYNWKSSHPSLTRELCKMTNVLGPLVVTGRNNCRTVKGNRSVKGSYHLYKKGCRAADLRMVKVKNSAAVRYWKKRRLGGTGTYRCRGFIHLDTGPVRSWHWNTKCRKRRR